ncbi:protein of unknown function [Bradyrhizobium vignae]|uniref:Uncharacterized protein n=1 Tax=Bradyrhizobium vignae TaxID=1549949 RepID=A0A2U3PVP9_9BRAD|nr:protein of unknown function [Bradyrhizobium vignae]
MQCGFGLPYPLHQQLSGGAGRQLFSGFPESFSFIREPLIERDGLLNAVTHTTSPRTTAPADTNA